MKKEQDARCRHHNYKVIGLVEDGSATNIGIGLLKIHPYLDAKVAVLTSTGKAQDMVSLALTCHSAGLLEAEYVDVERQHLLAQEVDLASVTMWLGAQRSDIGTTHTER